MNIDECVIRTLSYFDVFDYPLTFSEIKKYLCCELELTDDELYDQIALVPVVQESDGYYHLLGRNKITQMRSERYEISVEKLARAKIISKILSVVPTIDYIGISGSLSMNNASVSDDIDLFFITKRNTLWITRFLVNCILIIFGQKRKRKTQDAKDKICPNMFMEQGKLAFLPKQRTLYTAHEIVQLTGLVDRNSSYQQFIVKNKWIGLKLPNIIIEQSNLKKNSKYSSLLTRLATPFEKIAYLVQLRILKGNMTNEVVSKTRAAFHPIDRQKIIMDMYKLRSAHYTKLYIDNLWVDRDEARFYMEEKKIRILN